MEISLELLYQFQRGLLRSGWGQIEILVIGKATAEEFRELLGSTLYFCQNIRDEIFIKPFRIQHTFQKALLYK